MRRPAAVVVALAGLGLGLAACDSDDEPEVAAADVPFCDAYGGLLTGPLAEDGTDVADPAVLRDAVATTETLVADLVATAPAEVTAAVEELAAEYDATFAVLERYGYDVARVAGEATPEDLAVLDDFGTVPSGAGGDDPFADLQRFVADRCAPGITLPSDLLDPPGESTTTTSP